MGGADGPRGNGEERVGRGGGPEGDGCTARAWGCWLGCVGRGTQNDSRAAVSLVDDSGDGAVYASM